MSATQQQLDAIEAQVRIAISNGQVALVQIEALRQQLKQQQAPPPAPREGPRPERCAGIDKGRCAIQTEDAKMSRGNLRDRNAWQCRGCRIDSAELMTTTD